MPPPRLPRHLRPCHASGTAYQIRCARRTAHAQYSTTGDESPRTTTTNSDDADKRSWRSAALSGNAPWSYKTSLNKPEPQSQDTRLPDSSEDRKDTIEEQAPGFGTGLIRKTEETPAKRQRRLLLSRAGLHGKEADKTGSQDQDTVPVRKYESSSERPLGQPVVPRKVLSVSVSPNRSGDEQKQQGTIQKVQREHNPTAINEEETPISSHNEDTRIIRQQLQSLFEQVKNLQITLEAKIAADQQSFSTRKEKDTSTAASALPQNDGRHSTSIQPPLKDAPVTNDSVSFRGLKTTLPKSPFPKTPPSTLEYSQRVFRDSACTLAKAATQLEAMRSSAVTPVAQHARNRLRVLVEDAKLEGDHKLRTTIGCIYKNWQLLYAERKYSSGLGKRPGLLLKLEVIDTNAKSSKIWSNVKELKKELARISPRIPRAPRIVVSSTEGYRRQARGPTEDAKNVRDSIESSNLEKKIVGERLTRRIHTQSRQMKSSDDLNFITEDSGRKRTTVEQSLRAKEETTPGFGTRSETSPATTANMSPKPTSGTVELSEQSLLEELFPEAGSTPPPRQPEQSDRYPKLNLPDSTPIVRRELYDPAPSLKEQVVNSLRKQGEQITVLQLTNCSTELTEADFRRIIPKSKHIEGWYRDGDLYKVVPGRDPLSLERMPFYYLLFKNTEAAIAYQKNASRLHKLSTLHQPASIFSAIPAPKGFLEEGEDITAAISSYNLLPTHHPMSLNVLMQPYNPALRALIERGGYQPIAPSADEKGNPVWRVLMHIEGYEPTPSDLFKIFSRDAYKHGMTLPLRNESQTSIHRLRDVINLKTSSKPISSNRPRAYGTFDQSPDPQMETTYDDPAIQNMLAGAEEDNPSQLSQLVMNRVYNRWVLDFEDEDVARRWSLRWHRRVLPELSHTKGAWKDSEEARICNTELLW